LGSNAGYDEHGNVVQVNSKTGAQKTLDGVKGKGAEGTKLVNSEVAQGIGKYDAAETILG
jgi:hypothetical protein